MIDFITRILMSVEKILLTRLFQPDTVPLRTVNRQCSSGLQAVADVAASIKAGYYDIGQGDSRICIVCG